VGRFSYANVMATVAVFLALGGSATAAVIVSSNSEIAPNTIYGSNLPAGKNDNIVGGSVGTSDLAASAVTNGKLAAGAVGTGKLADGSVTVPKLGQDTIDRIDSHTGTATQFTGKMSVGSSSTVKTVVGVKIILACNSTSDERLTVEQASGFNTLQASGTASLDGTLTAVDAGGIFAESREGTASNFDVVARNSDIGTFARIDVHAGADSSGCPYWGVTQIAQ
jgi:hypothetical protein